MIRRRRQVEEQQPLGPEDDPYLAYLAWRAERDAKSAEQAELAEVPELGSASDRTAASDHAAVAGPARPSWLRRLTDWRRNDDQR